MPETTPIQFFVPGQPGTAGSKRAFVNKATGRANLVDMGGEKSKRWRSRVADFAMDAMGDRPPFDGPLMLTVFFVMPRPKGHYRTGKHAAKLRLDAPRHHTVKPDTTKLLRALEDSLKGICWRDDSQVSIQFAKKTYGDRPGATVMVTPIGLRETAEGREGLGWTG